MNENLSKIMKPTLTLQFAASCRIINCETVFTRVTMNRYDIYARIKAFVVCPNQNPSLTNVFKISEARPGTRAHRQRHVDCWKRYFVSITTRPNPKFDLNAQNEPAVSPPDENEYFHPFPWQFNLIEMCLRLPFNTHTYTHTIYIDARGTIAV